jgi:hypothetical protein
MATLQPTWGEIVDAHSALTADDLLRLPDDGYTYELYEGMLMRKMTSPAHGVICQRLRFELGLYARATGIISQDQIAQNVLFDLAPGTANRATLAPDIAILRPTTPLSWNVPRDTPLLAVG